MFAEEYPKYISNKYPELKSPTANVYKSMNVALKDMLENAPHLLQDSDKVLPWVADMALQQISEAEGELDPRARELLKQQFPKGLTQMVTGRTTASPTDLQEVLDGTAMKNPRIQEYTELGLQEDYAEFVELLKRISSQ